MQIVIDIDEDLYDTIKNLEIFITTQRSGKRIINGSINAIKNGIRLPKGHGKLIDSNVLWDAFQDLGQDFYEAFDVAETNAVIEADKEVDL